MEIPLGDSRAHKLLVIYSNGWQAIPSPETFSRHSGTCVILGDRNGVSPPYKVKLGDCFRLGSVGLVVSEMRVADGEDQRLDASMLQYLKDEALTLDGGDELATLAIEEGGPDEKEFESATNSAKSDLLPQGSAVPSVGSGGVGNGEKFICYMCYETHDTVEDPLVAPCDCKGDTRYLHVQCLQKWYQSSVCGPQSQVIRTTGNGAPACKICGTAYKTAFKRADGKRANLLEVEGNRPYISLVVVTRHDTNSSLFNTKFRLNFGRLGVTSDHLDTNPNEISIGRSSSCNMVLDYRTVSTVHAKVTYENGGFYLEDKKSSNGTMMYLQSPFPLSFTHPCRVRMGRTTITLQPKRSVTAGLREALRPGSFDGSSSAEAQGCYYSPTELQELMAAAVTSAYNANPIPPSIVLHQSRARNQAPDVAARTGVGSDGSAAVVAGTSGSGAASGGSSLAVASKGSRYEDDDNDDDNDLSFPEEDPPHSAGVTGVDRGALPSPVGSPLANDASEEPLFSTARSLSSNNAGSSSRGVGGDSSIDAAAVDIAAVTLENSSSTRQ